MALLNATSFAGFLLLLYLSSFVLLAILRIATGISIQRIGYFSLRHISYTPREGLRIDIRGLGLAIHRPTFARPTWVSLRLTDLCVTVDPSAINLSADNKSSKGSLQSHPPSTGSDQRRNHRKPRSDLWKKLTNMKEKLKRIHREIKWIKMIDITATNTSLEVSGVGSVAIGSFTLAIHTRRKLLDRGRLFRHKKDALGNQKPAEWILTVRSVLLGVGTREPVEMLDTLTVNIHGLLYKDKEGLRDTSVAVKIGRLYVPVDDFIYFQKETKKLARRSKTSSSSVPMSPIEEKDITFDDVVEELDRPGSREAAIVQTVADSKEFLSSVLRGVQEVQLGISFIRISKELEALRQANLPLAMNVVTHEIGIDLHRLDQNAPAHRMHFSRHDIAHQALLAMVSISVSLDEEDSKASKIMYIPMATATIKTTLPSKTMSFTQERDATERNSNILFANLVVTSPSVDLVPQHLIRLLALAPKRTKTATSTEQSRHRLISRLLPRASIKMSVQEPVVRFVLPVANPKNQDPEDFDMIISAISSISLDVESSHSTSGELLYSLASNFRLVNHRLYYQAASGIRHSLVTTDTLELKAAVSASTEVLVVVHGVLRSFSVLMVREEVSKSIYNIVRHFRRTAQPEKTHDVVKPSTSAFLRKIPAWILELHLEGSNCSFEAAGVDSNISPQTRGMAIELESWNADYVSQRSEEPKRPASRRKKSASVHLDEPPPSVTHLTPPSSPSRRPGNISTDSRRLAVHVKGIQGSIIESLEEWEPKPFMSVPKLEVAFTTNRDMQGPIFHVNSTMKSFFLDFSLYRLYSIGIAACMLKDAFHGPPDTKQGTTPSSESGQGTVSASNKPHRHSMPGVELITVDFKVLYTQIKAQMPADPPMMMQLYEVSTGRHRWSAPFIRCSLARLHAESPHIKSAWARIVTITGIRVDLRNSKKKHLNTFVEERSVEVMTDFMRLAVPHGLMMYKVFDNFINTFKASQQLAHRFKTRTNDYILKKDPEGPKHVPRISIRNKAFLFEFEDDAFEWKLGNIYHTGRREQMQRLAREEAFKLKVKKLQDERLPRGVSRRRALSSRRQSPRGTSPSGSQRSRSVDSDSSQRGRRSHSRGRPGPRDSRLRYDKEGACALSGNAKIEADDAWARLQEHNARIWKKRIDTVNRAQSTTIRNIRRMFIGADELPTDPDCHETILRVPFRPGLLTTIITDLHLIIDKPSFPVSDLPDFLHEVGKGMPRDMQYSLLIPLNIALDMGEARFMLRDYPLNLLHVPAIRPGQPPRLPSWSLRTDFVIAEEYRDQQSSRHIRVEIIPKGQKTKEGHDLPGFSVDVVRTVSAVKTFSKPVIDINTSQATSISWGTSYQPVIQDMMMIIEGFTKPEIDPSDRVGFWDKIRLSFHSRPVINWKGDGDVHLRLKGSRDPYVVTGFGAGFVMCWRNNVRWAIHESDDPRQFMTVRSGEYVLAIPDYSRQARVLDEDRSQHEGSSVSTASSIKNSASFKKVIMKVSGNVQWTAGLVFEQDLANGGRSSDFKHHYNVVLKNPMFMDQKQLHGYDAFRGFRSQHIHLSVSIAAPFDKDWTSNQTVSSESYNSIHLSPRFFSHFFNWWSLFSGVMSLPVRQGLLWRGPEKTSKKFGRHLSTIKYGILLSPLYIGHIYKHKDPEDYLEDVVSATGLKLRLDSFVLDVHQRREYFDTMSKGKSEQTRTSAMKINEAELDFINADLRAVAASIAGTNASELRRANDETLASYQEPVTKVDLSRFTIPDHDFSWIDMDDFVELDWVLPAEANPETKILPLAFTPRFTYFRQTDHGDGNGIHGDASRTSPFGNENTHLCAMSDLNDPRKVQMALIKSRLDSIEKQLRVHVRRMGESELKVVREGDHNVNLKQAHEWLVAQQQELEDKKAFLENGLKRLAMRTHPGDADKQEHNQQRHSSTTSNASSARSNSKIDIDGLFSAPQDEFASDFNNRFIIHNAQVKWNNSLRNIILRYMHQVSQRRGFVYYMSRRAVKFIIDIVEEQNKKKQDLKQRMSSNEETQKPTASTSSLTDEKDEEAVIQDRIHQLLNDGKRFVDVEKETAERKEASDETMSEDNASEEIAEDFLPMNAYHVRLIAPQVQLQSEKNTKSVVLLTAKGMQLKVVSIMDKKRLNDDVSGMVQRRFALDMDGVQIFVTTQKKLHRYLHMYSGNRYGNAPGSSWPPWASMEAMFDFNLDPFGFQRVIQKTSASLRYEKYNPLRLKYNEEVASSREGRRESAVHHESRIDHLWVDFPRLRASCDSEQYYTMYIIVLDLLMYSEPLEKTRNERLEKIMLATDFSDLRGAPEMAERLQERIRQLEEIKNHFQLNAKLLDRQGWKDRIDLEKDLVNCEDELFFIMKAINTSQQRSEERKSSTSSGFLRWYLSASEVVWHLMRSKDEPLLEFQLANAAYERIDNSDGSNHNAVEIERIRGWNLLSNAIYPEIIGPFLDPTQKQAPSEHERKMLRVHWYMLEAIAGIPVLEEFEVSVFPLKIQLERDLGKKLFEYIFPGIGSDAFDDGGFSPLMVKNMKPLEEAEDPEGEEARKNLVPEISVAHPSSEELRSSSPGAIGRRLQPTYNFNHPESKQGTQNTSSRQKHHHHHHHPHWLSEHGPFKHSNQPPQSSKDIKAQLNVGPKHKGSSSSLKSLQRAREGSTTSIATTKDDDKMSASSSRDHRLGIRRVNSGRDSAETKSNKSKKQHDDLSQMIARASNYMTIAHIKLNSFVICLSYKGKSERNLEDIHDFVFRLPTLEYRNKTWSNLDLALRLKKDVIRALISHTGAIIGNKLSHSRPTKKQTDRLREIAIGNTLIPNSETLVNTPSISSDATSLYSTSLIPNGDDVSPRASFQSDQPSMLVNTNGKEPSPLLKSNTWNDTNSSESSLNRSHPGASRPTTNGSQASGAASVKSMPRPRTRDSGIDPLGPISPPRPLTGYSSLLPGRSLLKGTIGRHLTGDTVKTKVRFTGGNKSGTDDDKDKDKDKDRDRDTKSDPESEGDTSRRVSVAMIKKRVLGRLGGD